MAQRDIDIRIRAKDETSRVTRQVNTSVRSMAGAFAGADIAVRALVSATRVFSREMAAALAAVEKNQKAVERATKAYEGIRKSVGEAVTDVSKLDKALEGVADALEAIEQKTKDRKNSPFGRLAQQMADALAEATPLLGELRRFNEALGRLGGAVAPDRERRVPKARTPKGVDTSLNLIDEEAERAKLAELQENLARLREQLASVREDSRAAGLALVLVDDRLNKIADDNIDAGITEIFDRVLDSAENIETELGEVVFLIDESTAAAEGLKLKMRDWQELSENVARQVAIDLADGLTDAILEGRKLGEVFDQLLQTVIRMVLQFIILRAITAAFGGFNAGGKVPHMPKRATTGLVTGPDTTVDAVPAILTPGEVVLSRAQAERFLAGAADTRGFMVDVKVNTKQSAREFVNDLNDFIRQRGGTLAASGL